MLEGPGHCFQADVTFSSGFLAIWHSIRNSRLPGLQADVNQVSRSRAHSEHFPLEMHAPPLTPALPASSHYLENPPTHQMTKHRLEANSANLEGQSLASNSVSLEEESISSVMLVFFFFFVNLHVSSNT